MSTHCFYTKISVGNKLSEIEKHGESYSRFDGHEEADCEGLVLVGEGDHHELPARPDVQVVRRHRELKQREQRTSNQG